MGTTPQWAHAPSLAALSFAGAGSAQGGGGTSTWSGRGACCGECHISISFEPGSDCLAAVTLHRAAQRVTVTFAPPTATPAGTRTYDVLRLRADKVSQPEARRPGANFRLVEPTAGVLRARGAWELPASEDSVTAVLAYDEGPVVVES